MQIKLSAFADEVSSSFQEQIDFLVEHDIPYLEMRGVDGKNVSEYTVEDAIGWKKRLDEKGIKVWSIGSPIGKIKMDQDFSEHLSTAEKLCKMANALDCKRMRIFSFYIDDVKKDRAVVLDRMNQLVALGNKYGVKMCHENEKEIYGDNAVRVAELLDSVNGLYSVFDPANYVQVGQDVIEALSLLQARTDYYHIKDAIKEDGSVVPSGKGDGKIADIIDGITVDAVLTLEPHLTVFDGYKNIDNTVLKNVYVFDSAKQAFSVAVSSLKEILLNKGFKAEKGRFVK